MRRRQFFEIAGGTAIVGCVAGGQFARQAYARSQLGQELVDQSLPILNEKAANELESLPATCRNEIREYFHGACLNVHGFVSELCSVSFGEQLRSHRSPDEQHLALAVLFTQKVVSPTEVLNRVNTITTEAGSELNHNWSECCKKLADSWQASVSPYGVKQLDVDKIVEPLIVQSIEEARHLAQPIGQRPALSETVVNVGKSALLLLTICDLHGAIANSKGTPNATAIANVMGIANAIVIPKFVMNALKHAFNYVLGQLNHRPENYQVAISEHLAILGNRVGSEFEAEIKKRVADLHYWQELAVRTAAAQKARELIPSFI